MSTRARLGLFIGAGLLIAAFLAFTVSPFASSSPDGLERVATDQGFISSASDHTMSGNPLADYGVSGIGNERLSTGVAGLIGVALCFCIGAGVGRLLRKRSDSLTVMPVDPASDR